MDRLQNLTPEKVKKFYEEMCYLHDAKIVQKDDSTFMKGLSILVSKVSRIEPEIFLKNYSTTIMDTIYIPYEVGNAEDMSLPQQIQTLVHELTHREDFDEDILMPLLYLADKNYRVRAEIKAWSANIEFKVKRFGIDYVPDFEKYGNKILNYDANENDAKVIASTLKSDHAIYIQEGKVSRVVENTIWQLKELGCWK